MPDRDISSLDEDTQAYVRSLREEAKTNRLKASELTTKLTERDTAVTEASARITELAAKAASADEVRTQYSALQDEHARALAESAKTALDHTRLKVALENGIPHTLASRLKGDDEAALKADALELKGFVSGLGTGAARVDRTTVTDGPLSDEDALKSAIAAQIESE